MSACHDYFFKTSQVVIIFQLGFDCVLNVIMSRVFTTVGQAEIIKPLKR